jgi:hypothetical protein
MGQSLSAFFGHEVYGDEDHHPPHIDPHDQDHDDSDEADFDDFDFDHIDVDNIDWGEVRVEDFSLERLQEIRHQLQESMSAPT